MLISDPRVSERRTIDKLLEALRELPGVRVGEHVDGPQHGRDRRCDAEVGFDVAGRHYTLLTEVKKSVYPRDAQQVMWQLGSCLAEGGSKQRKAAIIPFLAAESISEGAKDFLKGRSFGYFDTGGSLFIPARGAYFYVEKPPPKKHEKFVRSLFTGKRAQVLHALLVHPGDWFGVKELAEKAEVSSGTTSETLSALDKFERVGTRGQGPSKERRLSDARALLDEWKKQTLADIRRSTSRRYYVPGVNAEGLMKRLAQVCENQSVEYVITQEAAAQFYTPFLSSISRVTCRMTPGRAAEEAVRELGARAVTEGANLTIIETKTSGQFLFKERMRSIWLASTIQIYLDLLLAGGRAKEMAEHLRQERIGF